VFILSKVDWLILTAMASVFSALIGFYVKYILDQQRSSNDERYMRKVECVNNRKVSDMAILAMREDISEMRKLTEKMLGVLLGAPGATKNIRRESGRKKKKH
jgi:hypothetical protein